MKREKNALCKCHPDFHIPGDVKVGGNFNGREYAKKAKEVGVETLVFFAKCHYGFSYYPTKVGNVHPGLQMDMLGEFVKGCREEELVVTAYYSVFLDTAALKEHQDWILRADPEQSVEEIIEATKFLPVCVNSGYLDELLLPQALEIIENYDIDEFFYDTMSKFSPCYCDNCKRSFGKAIPRNSKDPDWSEYVNWYYNQYEQFFAKITRVIHEKNPEISVIFNWKWSANIPDNPVPHIKQLVGDLFPSGSISSFFSHYWAGTNYPFDYMSGRFLHGLGDWSSNTPETLKYTAAPAVANGGSFYLIDRQLPEGPMEERAYATMKEVFGFIRKRRDVLENIKHVPETVILYPFEHVVGPNLEYFPDNEAHKTYYGQRLSQFRGIANIFMNHAKHYTAMNSSNLNKFIDKYNLLILPEIDHINSETKVKIEEFVKKGGKLLITQSSNKETVDKDILDLAGAEYHGHSDIDYSYIENKTRGVTDPILVRGNFALITPVDGAETVANLISPLGSNKDGKDFGHGFAPPADSEGYAAVTRKKVGVGEVIYVAGPILSSHEQDMNPFISKLVLEIYDEFLPSPLVKVENPAQIEMTSVRRDDDLIVHLINHSGKEVEAGRGGRVTEYIPELFDFKLSIKSSNKDSSIISAPDGTVMDVIYENGYLNCKVPSLKIMRSFRIPGYFA